jgi:hypothetical protein
MGMITMKTMLTNMTLQKAWATAFAEKAKTLRELHAAQARFDAASKKLEALDDLRSAHTKHIMRPN